MASFHFDNIFHPLTHRISEFSAHLLHFWVPKPNFDDTLDHLSFCGAVQLADSSFNNGPQVLFGFKSGEFLDQFNNLNFSLQKNDFVTFELWQGAKSCWNSPSPSGNLLHLVGISLVLSIQYILCYSSFLQLGEGSLVQKLWNSPKTWPLVGVWGPAGCGRT